MNPATTFVSVNVSFAPTLKARRTDADATPLSTYRRNACSVPMPAGVIGKSVATLVDT